MQPRNNSKELVNRVASFLLQDPNSGIQSPLTAIKAARRIVRDMGPDKDIICPLEFLKQVRHEAYLRSEQRSNKGEAGDPLEDFFDAWLELIKKGQHRKKANLLSHARLLCVYLYRPVIYDRDESQTKLKVSGIQQELTRLNPEMEFVLYSDVTKLNKEIWEQIRTRNPLCFLVKVPYNLTQSDINPALWEMRNLSHHYLWRTDDLVAGMYGEDSDYWLNAVPFEPNAVARALTIDRYC